MLFKKPGEKTLITKGTLTGVISRLEDKGRGLRVGAQTDGRSQVIRLTAEGEALYEHTVPEHLLYIGRLFNGYARKPSDTWSRFATLAKSVVAARSGATEKPVDEINA